MLGLGLLISISNLVAVVVLLIKPEGKFAVCIHTVRLHMDVGG